MLPEHPIDECGNKINPRATETILRQFVDSGAIPFEERVAMEKQGLIVLNGSRFELTNAGKELLYGKLEVKASPNQDIMQILEDYSTVADMPQPSSATLDIQIGGDHYKKLGQYQPWQVCAACMSPAELRGYMKGTVIAYLMREQDKGGDLDIKKAAHTIQLWEEVRKDK